MAQCDLSWTAVQLLCAADQFDDQALDTWRLDESVSKGFYCYIPLCREERQYSAGCRTSIFSELVHCPSRFDLGRAVNAEVKWVQSLHADVRL